MTVSYAVTSPSNCGFNPTCSIITAPSWVQCSSSCVVSWYTASTSLVTPSDNKVEIQLSYIDFTNSIIQADQTDFWISLTPNLEACKSATILPSSTTSITLTLGAKLTTDLTPTDSVSETFKQSNYCGSYVLLWPDAYPSWLKVSTSDFTIQFIQTSYGSSSFDMEL